MKPTIVLIHGAYAESSSWNDVIPPLLAEGHRVVAWANPLRSVAGDSAALTDLVRSIDGPVVLVGHSYGGALMGNVPADAGDISALVFIAAYALNPGESCGDASGLVPGGSLGPTLVRVTLSDGGADTYIDPAKYHRQFAEDVDERVTALMAATQRPIPEAALGEPSAAQNPLWQTIPSWFLFGELDRNIPGGAHHIMAERVGARRTVEIAGGSHAIGVSHPRETTEIILEAANSDARVGS